MSEKKLRSVKRLTRYDAISRSVILGLVLLMPILFLPVAWLQFSSVKVLLVAILALVPAVLWAITRINAQSIRLPHSPIFWFGLALPFVALLSALFSGDAMNSIIGSGFERDTVLFTFFLSLIFASGALLANSVSIVSKILKSLNIAFIIIAVLQILRLVFGPSNFLPSVFSSNITNTVLGSWNDFAVLSGVVAIISLVSLAYAKAKARNIRIFSYVTLTLSLLMMMLVNLTIAWILLAVVALVLALFFITTNGGLESHEEGNVLYRRLAPAAVTLLLSLLFIFAGGYIGSIISKTLNTSYVDVRPSWDGTIEVVRNVYSDNVIFGLGPNTFDKAWVSYKPKGVNNTAFWNIDFKYGIGIVPTAFATVGLVGGIIWLLFILSILYVAFKALWVRTHSIAKKQALVVSALVSVYLSLLFVAYVPQAVVLAVAFLFIGIFVAMSTASSVIPARDIDLEKQHVKFLSTFSITTVLVLTVLSATILIQREVLSATLNRAVLAANAGDFDSATRLSSLARKISLADYLGGSDQISIVESQLALVDLKNVLSKEKSDSKDAELRTALEKVIAPARRAVEENPNSYSNHIFLANIYEQIIPLGIEGAQDAALSALNSAQKLNPTSPLIPLRKAQLAVRSKDMKTAVDLANEALKLKPNYTEAYYLLSQIAINEGNIEQAIKTTESATILAPNNPGILFQLGVLQYNQKEYEKAAAVLKRAVSINPNYANALYYLALTAIELKKTDDAIALFERVSKLNPDNEKIKSIIKSLKDGSTPKKAEPEKENLPITESDKK